MKYFSINFHGKLKFTKKFIPEKRVLKLKIIIPPSNMLFRCLAFFLFHVKNAHETEKDIKKNTKLV
jgi:hypothetical protein